MSACALPGEYDVLSVAQIARLLGMTRYRVQKLINAGVLTCKFPAQPCDGTPEAIDAAHLQHLRALLEISP